MDAAAAIGKRFNAIAEEIIAVKYRIEVA